MGTIILLLFFQKNFGRRGVAKSSDLGYNIVKSR